MKTLKLSNAAAFDAATAIAAQLGEQSTTPNRDAFLREAGRAESALKGGATSKGGKVSAVWSARAIAISAGLDGGNATVWASIWAVAVARNTREAIDASRE